MASHVRAVGWFGGETLEVTFPGPQPDPFRPFSGLPDLTPIIHAINEATRRMTDAFARYSWPMTWLTGMTAEQHAEWDFLQDEESDMHLIEVMEEHYSVVA